MKLTRAQLAAAVPVVACPKCNGEGLVPGKTAIVVAGATRQVPRATCPVCRGATIVALKDPADRANIPSPHRWPIGDQQ